MAIGPDNIASYNRELVKAIEQKIDANLSDANWVMDWRCGTIDKCFWQFTHPGEVSAKDKEKIIELYKNVGWRDVKIVNSAENDERPGMIGITLFK